MSGRRHHDGPTLHVTQGAGSSFKPALAPALLDRHLATPGFAPIDRLPDAEQGKADRAGNLAA